jgi:hypothetical protein
MAGFIEVGKATVYMGGDDLTDAQGLPVPLLVYLEALDDPAITDTPWLHLNLHGGEGGERYELVGHITTKQAQELMS